MKLLTLSLLIGSLLFAQQPPSPSKPAAPAETSAAAKADPPKLACDGVCEYWHAIAAHHSQNAAVQELLLKAEQAKATIVQIDRAIDVERTKLAALCGDAFQLDESSADPKCIVKPKPPTVPPPAPAPPNPK